MNIRALRKLNYHSMDVIYRKDHPGFRIGSAIRGRRASLGWVVAQSATTRKGIGLAIREHSASRGWVAAQSMPPGKAPSPPLSCAALLAEEMGESDLHAVMAAGFAGGIGLSGGACGALGAAVWIIGIHCNAPGRVDHPYQLPEIKRSITFS